MNYPLKDQPRIGTAKRVSWGTAIVKLSMRKRTVAPKTAIARMLACDVLRYDGDESGFTGADLSVRIVAQAEDARWALFEVRRPLPDTP